MNIAWTRSYDSWYQDEQISIDGNGKEYYTEYALTPPSNIEPPKAAVTVTEAENNGAPGARKKELKPGESEENLLAGDQRISLGNGTYKVKVKVKAAGDASHMESAWKAVTFKVRVK